MKSFQEQLRDILRVNESLIETNTILKDANASLIQTNETLIGVNNRLSQSILELEAQVKGLLEQYPDAVHYGQRN